MGIMQLNKKEGVDLAKKKGKTVYLKAS